ncbi:hypothetical protein F4825DRAFT_476222 [Nemania diffusa]|nr:hypothetical protein F4825DRAFT_476222 [Nemania diffusa]
MADHSGDDHLGNEHPGVDHVGDNPAEDDHSEDEQSEEEQSEEEEPEEEPEEEEPEEEESEEEVHEEWYEYLGLGDMEEKAGFNDDDYDDASDFSFEYDPEDDERTFPKFMELPPELRRMIWKKALPKGRILRICPPLEIYDKWKFPREMLAPDILNPESFEDFPLAAVCRESRMFIEEYGYYILWPDLMTPLADKFVGPWFSDKRDRIEVYTDDDIALITTGGRSGDWLLN